MGLCLTPVLTLWGGDHFDGHMWITSYCTLRFCALQLYPAEFAQLILGACLLRDNLNACVI